MNKLLKESLWAWLGVIVALRLVESLENSGMLGGQVAGLMTAVFLLYVPILIYLKKGEKVGYFDREFSDLSRSLTVCLVFSLIIFSSALLVNHLFQTHINHFSYQPGIFLKPYGTFFSQLVMIALPEEFFFRGYLLGRFDEVFGKTRRLLGVAVGPGLLLVSLIFAVSHSLISFAPWHILIFFPALAFGWLREKTGTLTAPILFHTFCNIFSHWVAIHYF